MLETTAEHIWRSAYSNTQFTRTDTLHDRVTSTILYIQAEHLAVQCYNAFPSIRQPSLFITVDQMDNACTAENTQIAT